MIYHLQVPKPAWLLEQEGAVSRACDPVLTVHNLQSLTSKPEDVTCQRCPHTRAFQAAVVERAS